MATMDIFSGDAFGAVALGEAINVIPNMYGRIGELGLFTPKPIRTEQFSIESKNGELILVQSSPSGTDVPGMSRGKRTLRNFNTRRFAIQRRITAADVANIRQFGSETEVAQVLDEVNERLIEIRSSLDITREYLRSGAIAGKVLDADGTVISNFFTDFGVTEKVVDFDLGTATTNHEQKVRQVLRHIEANMLGDTMTGVRALCSPEFYDKLLAIQSFKDAYSFYQASSPNPLRDDVRRGLNWKGIIWEEYIGQGLVPQEDGTKVAKRFIPAGDVRFLPEGTTQTFRDFNAPADYMETVGQPGQPFYSKVMPDPNANRYVTVEGLMMNLPVCMRPGVLVRGFSST